MKTRRKPSMILFDYGLTLIQEPDFDPLRGDRALLPYITKNKNGISVEEISAFARRAFLEAEPARAAGFEVHEHMLLRLLNDSLGLEYSITIEEQERIFWENASTFVPMPNIEQLLDYLNIVGIRTAVVSNISFSGKALKRRIDAALPRNRFEFVIASSDYGVRKPSPRIFQVALQKAGVLPEDAWFCGDNFDADITGAAKAGIFPVWYRGGSESKSVDDEKNGVTDLLMIHDWQELIEKLNRE